MTERVYVAKRALWQFLTRTFWQRSNPGARGLERAGQLQVMWQVTLIVLVTVWLDLRFFWRPHRPAPGFVLWLPGRFLAAELGAILLSLILGNLPTVAKVVHENFAKLATMGDESVDRREDGLTADQHETSEAVQRRCELIRKGVGGWAVIISVVLNTVAIWAAVDATGGPLQSPLAPLLAAPPIFGVFMAQRADFNFYLLIYGTVFLIGHLDHHAQKTHYLVARVPDWRAFFLPVAALTIIAGQLGAHRFKERPGADPGGGGSPKPAGDAA